MFFSKNKIKLLSDENVPFRICELLSKRYDVKRVSCGISDKKLSKIARIENRVILTFDKHFLNKRLFPPRQYSGTIVIDIHPPLIDSIFPALSKLFSEIPASKFSGRLFVLSSLGFKIFPR